MLVSVAALCTHDKPWVRTMARRVVRAVLTDPVTAMDNGLHAASNGVGQLIQQQLQNALGTNIIPDSLESLKMLKIYFLQTLTSIDLFLQKTSIISTLSCLNSFWSNFIWRQSETYKEKEKACEMMKQN